MAASFDYNLSSSGAPMGRYTANAGWAPGFSYAPANSGRFASTLGGETARGAASTRNQALQEIYGMYRQNLSNMAQLSGQGFANTMEVAKGGISEISGTNRSMFQNAAVVADNALQAKSNAQVNQANLDQNAYIARQQQKEADAARSGSRIGGILGAAGSIASSFIPNPALKTATSLIGGAPK
jgi:hypothetical protein